MKRFACILAAMLCLSLPRIASAQVPNSMVIQGVSPSTGIYITGIASILQNGTSVYAMNFTTTTSATGVFNVQLTNLSSATFASSGTYSLQFYMAGATTAVSIQSVPFAFHAAYADNASQSTGTAILSANQTFTGQNTFTSSTSVTGIDSSGYSLYLSSGLLAAAGTITAANFVGNGAGLTGISGGVTCSSCAFLPSTQTFTGAQTFSSSASFTASGASIYSLSTTSGASVGGGLVAVGTVTAAGFLGSGAGMSNVYHVVGSSVAMSTTTTLTISGLSIVKSIAFRVEVDWISGTSGDCDMSIYVNGDTTATDYYRRYIQAYGSASPGQAIFNDASVCGMGGAATTAGDSSSCETDVHMTPLANGHGGVVTYMTWPVLWAQTAYSSANVSLQNTVGQKTATVTDINVVSLIMWCLHAVVVVAA